MISILILKAIDSTWKSKRFSYQSSFQGLEDYICSFFQNKPVQRVKEETEEINSIADEGKKTKNKWENDD